MDRANLMPKPTKNRPAIFSKTRPIHGLARMRCARKWVSNVAAKPYKKVSAAMVLAIKA